MTPSNADSPYVEATETSVTHQGPPPDRTRSGPRWVAVALGAGILTIITGVLGVASVQAYEFTRHYELTSKFKINQLGQQVLAETMLAGSKIPSSLRDVEGIKEDQLVDDWGREFEFIVPGPGDSPFDIVSYGRDGKLGGSGRDADLRYSEL